MTRTTTCIKVLTTILVTVSLALADEPGTEEQEFTRPVLHFEAVPCGSDSTSCLAPNDHRGWMSVDYLLWSLKGAALPTPLLTTGSVADEVSGALGQPGTRILYGGSEQSFDVFSGMRFGAGFWLPSGELGIELGGFILEKRVTGFSTQSDANGSPLIGRPFFNPLEDAENTLIDSIPGSVVGGVDIRSELRLWGWEANVTSRWSDTAHLLLGYRTLDLRESLRITDVVSPLESDVLTFQGNFIDAGSLLADFDQFSTHNQFHGVQLGGRGHVSIGRLDLGVVGKLGVGWTRQTVSIDGASFLKTPGGAISVVPGGLLAQTTNIGRHSDDQFTVVPEVGLSASFQIKPRLRVRAGYNYLYWSSVVRPGDQIDRTVNPRLVPTAQDFGLPAGPPSRPGVSIDRTDFWAHGLDFGLEYRY